MLTSSNQDSSDVQQPAGNKFYFIVPVYITYTFINILAIPQTSSLALGLDSSRLIELLLFVQLLIVAMSRQLSTFDYTTIPMEQVSLGYRESRD